jgi:hypothetical protein
MEVILWELLLWELVHQRLNLLASSKLSLNNQNQTAVQNG